MAFEIIKLTYLLTKEKRGNKRGYGHGKYKGVCLYQLKGDSLTDAPWQDIKQLLELAITMSDGAEFNISFEFIVDHFKDMSWLLCAGLVLCNVCSVKTHF